jgi:hypothetical protein
LIPLQHRVGGGRWRTARYRQGVDAASAERIRRLHCQWIVAKRQADIIELEATGDVRNRRLAA